MTFLENRFDLTSSGEDPFAEFYYQAILETFNNSLWQGKKKRNKTAAFLRGEAPHPTRLPAQS